MLEAGDQILLRMPGGGGYGDPLDRDPHLVAEDLRDELIGREAAEAVYGVVIGVDFAPDASATARRREELRHAAS